jgi:hypothetical protein
MYGQIDGCVKENSSDLKQKEAELKRIVSVPAGLSMEEFSTLAGAAQQLHEAHCRKSWRNQHE